MYVLFAYAVAIFLLSLFVPLATQILVNSIATGISFLNVLVLSVLLFLGLFLAGVIQMLQLGVVEVLQQRVFATTALKIGDVLARVCARGLRFEYAPELVNRFFDVLTVQKALAKLLVDGLTALVQTGIGLVILGFYSPVLLALDFFLIVGIVGATLLCGIGGLRTSLKESKAKYVVADWLEDIARCHTSMKVHGDRHYLTSVTDGRVVDYITYRKQHFRVTLRQTGAFYVFQAVAQAGALAGGGFQVLNGTLMLGQLVAAQIIIATVLASMEKLIRQADQFFDLLTGLDKVGHVTDLPLERDGGGIMPLIPGSAGAEVVCRNVKFSYIPTIPVLNSLTMTLRAGERVSLVGASGAGKSTLGMLLCGLEDPTHGTIEIDGVELRTLCLESIRKHISMIGYENELFDGTIQANILVGREDISPQDVRWALDVARLSDDIAGLPEGLNTHVISSGKNLSRGQIQRLLIARAVVGRPRLLILDEAFTGIDEQSAMAILDSIFAIQDWTIIDISHDSAVIQRTETVYVLAQGQILQSGPLMTIASESDGEFAKLFPILSQSLRARGVIA